MVERLATQHHYSILSSQKIQVRSLSRLLLFFCRCIAFFAILEAAYVILNITTIHATHTMPTPHQPTTDTAPPQNHPDPTPHPLTNQPRT